MKIIKDIVAGDGRAKQEEGCEGVRGGGGEGKRENNADAGKAMMVGK